MTSSDGIMNEADSRSRPAACAAVTAAAFISGNQTGEGGVDRQAVTQSRFCHWQAPVVARRQQLLGESWSLERVYVRTVVVPRCCNPWQDMNPAITLQQHTATYVVDPCEINAAIGFQQIAMRIETK